MISKLGKRTVCLIVVLAMVLTTLSVTQVGFADSGTNKYEISAMVMYKKADGRDVPVPGVSVILLDLHTGVQHFNITDDNGYSAFNVEPGHYMLMANAPDDNFTTIEGANGSKSGIIEVIDKGVDVDPLFLKNVLPIQKPIYSLSGYIFYLGANDAVVNAIVVLQSIDDPGYEASSQGSGPDGNYSIDAYKGQYELWITLDEYMYYIEDLNLNVTEITNHNLTLNNSKPGINGWIKFEDTPESDSRDAFLYDVDRAEFIHKPFTGVFFNLPAYFGNFSLIIDVPGYQPYYHPQIIELNSSRNFFPLPNKIALKVNNDEKLVTSLSFPTNNWNKIHLNTKWTLNHDSAIFGLEYVNYGVTTTIGGPRFQIDNEPGFGGTSDGLGSKGFEKGEVETTEINNFTAWLQERGPYYLDTQGIISIENTNFNWNKGTFSVSTTGFNGAYDSTADMIINTNLDYNSYDNKISEDSESYMINIAQLLDNEVVKFYLPDGYELSNLEAYDNQTVWIKSSSQCWLNGSAKIYVEKLKDPTARFLASPKYVDIEEDIDFNGVDSLPGSGMITNYTWDFNDGSKGYGKSVSHNYTTPGVYNVTLNIMTTANLVHTNFTIITVDSTPPVVKFRFVNETGVEITEGYENTPQEVYNITFNATQTSDSLDSGATLDGEIASYSWTFGDTSGTLIDNDVAYHSYNNPGSYDVTLNVTDAAGHYTLLTKSIFINDLEPPEPKMKTGSGELVCYINETLELNASITTDNYDPIENLTFRWDLDTTKDGIDNDGVLNNDKEDDTGAIITFKPERPGPQPIALWVTDSSDNEANSTDLQPIDWIIIVEGVDLRFAPIDETNVDKYLDVSKKEPIEEESVNFKVNITNDGRVTARDIVVTFSLDGKVKNTKTIQSLEMNEFEVLTFKWKASGVGEHNISFNVTLANNETFEQNWVNNYKKIKLEVREKTFIDTPILVAIIIIVIIVVVVMIYFYLRRREEAEFGKRRSDKDKAKGKGKSKDKGKGKGKGKSKGKKSKK